MEGSSTGQNSGMNPNENPSHSSQLQVNIGVPSIFLGPANMTMSSADANASNNSQTTQTSAWNNSGAAEAPRVRSPPNTSGSADSFKMKTCASTQCSSNGYEGLSSNMAVGGCQPPLQNRAYPPYMQQQQIAVPIRSMHQHHHHHHHHHGIPGTCHPQQSTVSVAPHLDRMLHGGSSVAVAAAQQMRSMVMSHYPPNTTGYPHQSSAPSASAFYPQTVATAAGNGPFLEYNHPQNVHHHHHGHSISAAAAAAVQYAHQQQQHHQRMVNSAAASLSPYRQIPVHHHPKVINSSQAATAYQNAYQQHQYNQYMHQQHGMMPSHSHPHHQTGTGTTVTGGVIPQRMLGIPISSMQQQQQAYMNRGQHMSHLQHQHNHNYTPNCQPPLVSNYSSHLNQQQQLTNAIVGLGSGGPSVSNANATVAQLLDLNNNSNSNKIVGSLSDALGTKTLSKTSSEAFSVNPKSPMKMNVLKVTASPEKSVKIKSTRSVTKLRDRQPRLVVGQKKKSAGSVVGGNNSKKLKSLKALSAVVSSGGTTAGTDNLHSCGKRLTSSLVDTDGNGDAKRSRKVAKTEEDTLSSLQPVDTDELVEETNKNSAIEDELIGELNKSIFKNFFLEEQNGDEYIPTPGEMRKYVDRLNTCNTLNIPLYFAYSVFHGKLANKNGINSTGNSSSRTTGTTTAEGTFTTSTSTTTSTTVLYHHPFNQLEEFNFTTFHNWDSSALSSAEAEWNNFQDDMAVLEAYFPLLSTMEQSERAEKLDTIYTYEGEMKLVNSTPSPSAACNVGGDPLSPPCPCIQDTTSCSCCYNNYMSSMLPSSVGSPEQCGGISEQMACRDASFVSDASQRFVIDPSFHHNHPQPHFMSTPLSSRRAYAERTHFYDEENDYCFKDSSGSRNRVGARKRSSSYPSRKSGRRSSTSRDHRKSETESFLDELISTANDEKLSKQRNNSGEITAPEIQCEVDFPSLTSSAALPRNKRQTRKGKAEESHSARDDYMVSSCTATEESESNSNSSACSSSPQSTHNTSSEADFDGGSEITLIGGPRVLSHCVNATTTHPILLAPSCGQCDDTGACCTRPAHLWDEFRENEMVSIQTESFSTLGATSCAHMANLISHCTCRRAEAVCATRPPPGFEHLARPAFPIELYDPSLLGNLVGGQLSREVLSSLDSSACSRKQFEEMEELLQSLTCCEKHAVDKMLYSRRTSFSSVGEELSDESDDDWDSLEKAIKTVLYDWTEELGFRKRMQDILFSLNLQDVYGGCCKSGILVEHGENENLNVSFGGSTSASPRPITISDASLEPSSAVLQCDIKSP